jgi:ADP-ribose pyrophosphatase
MAEVPSGDHPSADLSPIADQSTAQPVQSSEQVYSGRVWDLRRDVVELGDGTMVREYVEHPGAVAVLALDERDRVFLICQYRHPIRTRDWEIPAGLLDVPGEDPLAAAQRELAEEADLAASDWAVLVDFFSSPGSSDEAIRIYLARGVTSTDEPFAREDEEAHMETRWLDLDACVDAVLERRVQNPTLVIGVLAAQAARARGWAGLAAADAEWPGRSTPREEPAPR